MKIDKAHALAYISGQHLRLKRSRHVELVLAEASATSSSDLLQRQDAVYDKYRPLLQQLEDEHQAIENQN